MNAKSVATFSWFALGAVGIHDSQWRSINSTLTTLKTRYFPETPADEIEIKSTTLRARGTFRARWPWTLLSASQASAFTEDVYAIYADYGLPLFSAGLDKVAHAQTGPNPKHPYEVTFAALLRSINQFLAERNEIGLCFMDEFKGLDRHVISWYTWRHRTGEAERIIERPTFVVSRASQMISLADILVYNVYRQFRESDSTYPYFVRLEPQIVELVKLPENKRASKTGSS